MACLACPRLETSQLLRDDPDQAPTVRMWRRRQPESVSLDSFTVTMDEWKLFAGDGVAKIDPARIQIFGLTVCSTRLAGPPPFTARRTAKDPGRIDARGLPHSDRQEQADRRSPPISIDCYGANVLNR